MSSILIAGSTGLVGSQVLAQALKDVRVTRIVAPTRRPLPPHEKLLNPIFDPAHLPADADWWAVDGVISALGTTHAKAGSEAAFRAVDFDLPLAIAKLTRVRGAGRFALTSSMGANARSPISYTRTKGELEEAIARIAFPSFTIVRPGLLGGKRAEFRLAEHVGQIVLGAVGFLLPPSLRISPADVVAKLLLEAALVGENGRHRLDAAAIALSGKV
ncbi:MAG: oxidoreductase [Rhizomicrobium sp.]